MYTLTAERLLAYADFDPTVVDRVASAAEAQAGDQNSGAFFMRIGLPAVQSFAQRFGEAPLQVIDYRPDEHDSEAALVLHLPMANPLDDNQRYQIGTVIAANPNTRVIAAGNPSGGRWDSGRLDYSERQQLRGGNSRPLAMALDRYLTREKISQADHAGESYGTRKAAALARYGQRAVNHLVLIEPIIGERSLPKLGRQFLKTNKALKTYTRAPGLEQFNAARKSDTIGNLAYLRGLLTATNIAIARDLARGNVVDDVEAVLDEHEQAVAHLIWGSESEFGTDAHMPAVEAGLRFRSKGRVKATRLAGHKHALMNDIHLKAALISQALAA